MLAFENWEIGVFEALVRPDVLPLFVGAWLCLLLGAGIQLLLLKKCTGFGRWGVAAATVLLLIVTEIGLRLNKGWEAILFVLSARLLWYPLLGAGFCALVWRCVVKDEV